MSMRPNRPRGTCDVRSICDVSRPSAEKVTTPHCICGNFSSVNTRTWRDRIPSLRCSGRPALFGRWLNASHRPSRENTAPLSVSSSVDVRFRPTAFSWHGVQVEHLGTRVVRSKDNGLSQARRPLPTGDHRACELHGKPPPAERSRDCATRQVRGNHEDLVRPVEIAAS